MKKTVKIFAALLSLSFLLGGCALEDAHADTSSSAVSGATQDTTAEATPSTAPDSTPDTTAEPTPSTASDSVPDTTAEPTSSTAPDPAPTSKHDAIPFTGNQFYAAAYLGYQQIDDWDYYASRYLDTDALPIHYVSPGDFYLVIPRYEGMSLSLYVNDIDLQSTLRYEDPSCGPFIIQCNISDVFSDVTVRLSYNGESVEFSPFISLENGQPLLGERGLDLTAPAAP